MKRNKIKRIDRRYLLAFTIVFIVEALIAVFVRDTIIRPLVGDILVVILIYLFIKSFILKPIKRLSLYIFIFATGIEFAQYFHFVELLNLQDHKIIAVMLGNTYNVYDILCYFIGARIITIWEVYLNKRTNTK